MDFHAAAVRFGKPGKLYIAPLGTTEPTTVTAAWPSGWEALGFTDEGSTFNYNQTREKVYVAERRTAIGSAPGDVEAGVEFSLVEATFRNLKLILNRGFEAEADDTGTVSDGASWSMSGPDDDNEVRVMLGWDAYETVGSNDLRFIWRECLNVAQLSWGNKKGATKVAFPANYEIYTPASGLPPFKVFGTGTSNPTI